LNLSPQSVAVLRIYLPPLIEGRVATRTAQYVSQRPSCRNSDRAGRPG
jgi:hypothetical protein